MCVFKFFRAPWFKGTSGVYSPCTEFFFSRILTIVQGLTLGNSQYLFELLEFTKLVFKMLLLKCKISINLMLVVPRAFWNPEFLMLVLITLKTLNIKVSPCTIRIENATIVRVLPCHI